jgi:hypothetical protein
MRPLDPLGAAFDHGDGDPNCSKCKGHGAIDIPPDLSKGRVTPARETCVCVRKRDLKYNVNRGWRGLWKAKPIPESVLSGWENDNLFITAKASTFKKHLRHVAVRQSPRWHFQVSSDADLVSAWLSNMAQKGADINDPDVILSDLPPISLPELIEPPALLVVMLGIKKARNAAAPEVLHETLHRRMFEDKPTWVVDQPSDRLMQGHLAWSESVDEFLSEWDSFDLEDGE